MKKEPLGINRLWSAPFPVQVRGGLRQRMNQYSDVGGVTILTPKDKDGSNRRGYSGLIPTPQTPTPPPTPVFSGLMPVFKSTDGSISVINQDSPGTTITVHTGIIPPTIPNIYFFLPIVTLNCNKGLFAYEWFEDDVSTGNTNPYFKVTISGAAPVYGTVKYNCIVTFLDASTADFEVSIETAV